MTFVPWCPHSHRLSAKEQMFLLPNQAQTPPKQKQTEL